MMQQKDFEQRVSAFVGDVVGAMGLAVDVTVEEEPDHVRIVLEGTDGEWFVRRKGEALDALQHVVNAAFQREVDRGKRLVVACAMMLPYQMAYSLSGAPEKYAAIGRALNPALAASSDVDRQAQGAVEAVQTLNADLGLPAHLGEVGVTEALLPSLAQAAFADLNWWTNPRPVNEAEMGQLYQQAF